MKMDRKIKTEANDEKIKGTRKRRSVGAKSARKSNGKQPPMPYEHAPIGILESSLDGKYLNVNKEFCRILGYKKQELLKGDIELFTHEEDYPIDMKLYQQLVAGEIPFYKLEKRYVHKDGGIIWAELTRSAVRNAKGKILYIVSTALDIDERKKSEAQAKWQAHLLAELADAVISTDENFVLTGWNKAAEEIYGWKAEEVLGKDAQDILQTEFVTGTREAAREQTSAMGSFSGEVSQVRKNGTRIIVEGKVLAIRDEEEKIQGYVSVNRDITERKRADDALRESQHRFSATYQYAPIGIVECSPEGKYLNVNEEFCNLLRYPKEELIGHGFKGITHEDDYPIDIRLHQKLVAGEIPFYKLEKRYMRKDGKPIWAEITRSPVRAASGNVLYTIGTVLDISERKQVESVLRESVERLRLATEAARMFTWEWDFENEVFTLPDSFTRVIGFSADLLPKNSLDTLQSLVPIEDLESIVEAYQKTIEQRGDLYALPCRVINPENDQVAWLEISAKIVYDQAGNPERMFGVAQNVTETKNVQNEVAIISRMPEENPNPVMRLRPDGSVIYANGPSRLMLEAWRLAGDQTVPDELQQRVAEAFASGSKKVIEITQGKKTFTCTLAPVLEAGYVNFYGNEITARKRAEQALREFARQQGALYQLSDQLHRTTSLEGVFNAALDAILNALQCDRASILLFDDADVMRFVAWRGLSDHYREATTGHSPWTADAKHPEPISINDIRTGELSDSLRAVIDEEGIGSLAFIPLVSNGKLIGKFMVYFNTPHEFSEGEIDLSLTIAHQLAFGIERKRAEEALAREQELLERLFETMPVMVSMYDPETNSLRLNAEFERLIGWTTDEVSVVSLLESLYPDPDYRQQVLQRMAAAASTNEWVEVQVQTRDGRKLDSLWSNVSIVNDQKLVRGIAIGIDITERKRIEQDLTRERELLNRIFESIPVMLTVYEPSTQLLRVNSQFEKLIGWSSEEAAGVSLMEAVYPEPNYREEVWQFMDRAAEDEWMDIQMRTRHGRTLETSWSNRRLSNDMQVGIGIDITERRQAEKRLALLAEISEMLRNFEDPKELLYAVSRAVGEHLQLKRCLFNEINLENDRETVHRDYYSGVPSVMGVHKVSDYSPITSAEMAGGKTVVNRDSKIDPRTALEYESTYGPSQERAYVAIPLMRENRWVASFWVSDDIPRPWSDEDVSLLEAIAERTWTAVEKLRLAEELRAKEAELEEIINQTPFMLTRCSRDLRYRFVSRAYAKMIGRKPEDVAGKPIVEIMGEEGFRTISPYVEKVLQGEVVEYESEVDFQGVGAPFLHVAYTPDRDEQGNVIGWFASIVDINERKRAEEALRIENERFMRFVNSNIVGILIGDASGKVVLANDYYLRLLGVSRQDFDAGTVDWRKFTPPEWQPADEKAIQELGERGVCEPYEKEYVRADGTRVPVYITDAMLPGSGEEIAAFVLDITERKRAEEALRRNEKMFSTLINAAPFGVYLIDSDFRLRAVNKGSEAVFSGIQPLIGRDFAEILRIVWQEPFATEAIERFRHTLRTGESFISPPIIEERANVNEIQSYDWQIHRIPLADGTYGVVCYFYDLSEQKRMEAAVRASETLYRTIARNIPNGGVYVVDKDFRYLVAEGSVTEAFGLSRQILEGHTVSEVFQGEQRSRMIERLERNFAGETLNYENEHNGRVYWTQQAPLLDAIGQAIIVTLDITERKQAELALRESEERFAQFMQHLPALAWIKDMQGRYVYANAAAERAFNTPQQELYGKTDQELFSPEIAAQFRNNDEHALMDEKGVQAVEALRHQDGVLHYSLVNKFPIPGTTGTPTLIGGTAFDITERLQAEEALRESEERFSAILRQATAGIVRKDRYGKLIYVNQAFCNMLGYTEAELLNRSMWDLIHEDDRAENQRLYNRLMLEGVPFKLERRLVRENGSVIWMDASVSPIMDAEGKPQSAVTVEVDITARKHAEAALQQLNVQLEERVLNRTAKLRAVNQTLRDEIAERKRVEEALRQSEATARSNEEKLSTLFDLLPVGISFLDPEGQIIQMNSALANILKLSKEQLLRGEFKSRKYIRADGTPMQPTELASVRALAENRTVHNVETGALLENGQIVWMNVSAAPVDVAEVGVVVVTVDITDSKRAERALQESHARLRILSQRLVEVQEEERRALARELHDRVGQTLAALNINLIIINSQLTPEVSQQIGTRLNDSMKLVAETIALVRDVMTDLRPSVLDDYGLEAALESQVAQYTSRYEIETKLEKPDRPLPRLGSSIEMTFLRIAQEALMNIAKHAHASRINLSLRQEGDIVCLTIRDNGIGIESWDRANRPGSHGLTIMRERAEAFSGTLSVNSVPGEGTTLEVSIPIRTNAQKENGQKEEKTW